MNQKMEKGITLIALVITIIVLLILAGVTINMVLGDEGIISNAQTAKEKHSEKTYEEIAQLAVLTYRTNEKTGEENGEITSVEGAIENALKEEYGEGDYVTEVNGNLLVTVGENKFFIEENGIVTKTITFNINDTTYSAEAGMTWKEWVESSYNIDNYWIDGLCIRPKSDVDGDNVTSAINYYPSGWNDYEEVKPGEKIITERTYYTVSLIWD